jgi:site-specific DNA-methyltransferase (adenine-specific)
VKPYYERDGVTLYHADCRDVIEALVDVRYELVVTDPPYASGARRDADRQVRGAMLRSMEDVDWFSHDAMTSWGFTWFLRSVFTLLRPRLPEGTHVYAFTDWRQCPNVFGLLEACGYRVNRRLTWDKGVLGMGSTWRNQDEDVVFASHGAPAAMLDRGMGTVLQHPPVTPAARVHPTEKPVGLLRRIIDAVPGGVVFDPFAGSGPTLVAAHAAGRRAIGAELEEHYCEIAARRIDAALDGVGRLERAAGQAALFPPTA